MDFFIVSMMNMGSYEMFASFIGTWLPFELMFAATCLTGLFAGGSGQSVCAAH